MDEMKNDDLTTVSQFTRIPAEILVEITYNSGLEILSRLASTNKELETFISEPYILNMLAEKHYLPYSKSIHQLFGYSKLDTCELFAIAVKNCDTRVILAEKCYHDQKFIHDTIIDTLDSMVSGECLTPKVVDMFLSIDSDIFDSIINNAIRLNLPDVIDMLVLRDGEYIDRLMEFAVEHDNIYIVEHLLDLGSTDYKSALWLAARWDRLDLVNQIIEIESDVDTLNAGLSGAASSGNMEMLNLFIEAGADDYEDALITSADYGQLEPFTALADYNDYNIQESVIGKALVGASRHGMVNIITEILNIGMGDSYIIESMFEAATRDQLDSFNMLLLEANSRFDHLDIERLLETSIREAALHGSLDIVNKLKSIDNRLIEHVNDALMSSMSNGDFEGMRNVYSVGPSIEIIREMLDFGMITRRFFVSDTYSNLVCRYDRDTVDDALQSSSVNGDDIIRQIFYDVINEVDGTTYWYEMTGAEILW